MTATAPRAPGIAEKLEAARAILAAHNGEVAQTVLDAAENVPGATKRLCDLRAQYLDGGTRGLRTRKGARTRRKDRPAVRRRRGDPDARRAAGRVQKAVCRAREGDGGCPQSRGRHGGSIRRVFGSNAARGCRCPIGHVRAADDDRWGRHVWRGLWTLRAADPGRTLSIGAATRGRHRPVCPAFRKAAFRAVSRKSHRDTRRHRRAASGRHMRSSRTSPNRSKTWTRRPCVLPSPQIKRTQHEQIGRTDESRLRRLAAPPTGCVIADGKPHCMHPCKGGVPFNFKNDPAIQKIYADACSALGVPNKNVVTQ